VKGLRLDDYLPYRLSVAANAVSDLIARAYKTRFGLTVPQWRVIAVLGEGDPLAPQALVERTVMDKVTISRAAAALVGRGLISRAPDAADGRSHRLELTAEGRRLYGEVAPVALAYEAELLSRLGDGVGPAANALLARLQAAADDLNRQG
jgi:DNA-binding MarR family transcriptional regulator